MTQSANCPPFPATPSPHLSSATLKQRIGRVWRRLVQNRRLDPDAMSTHMLRDLGLPDHAGDDPLERERLRQFF